MARAACILLLLLSGVAAAAPPDGWPPLMMGVSSADSTPVVFGWTDSPLYAGSGSGYRCAGSGTELGYDGTSLTEYHYGVSSGVLAFDGHLPFVSGGAGDLRLWQAGESNSATPVEGWFYWFRRGFGVALGLDLAVIPFWWIARMTKNWFIPPAL